MSKTTIINQVSVYLENKEGALKELLDCIDKEGVNLQALSIADTTDFGIVRLVVDADKQEQLVKTMTDFGLIARSNEVLGVTLSNEPGALAKIVEAIDSIQQQIEYAYSIAGVGDAQVTIVIQTSNNEACAKAIAAC